jgi:hypothetical protein
MSHEMPALRASAGMALIALLASAPATAQDPQHHESKSQVSRFEIPASIRAEHSEIHSELVKATKARGNVGAAARALAALLDPHFAREEQIALRPLSLLEPLSRGETTPAMRDVLPMTDSLRGELPRMLREHVAIRAATEDMGRVAKAAGNVAVAHLAEKLALHAQGEEELFYPAAVLVGDLVRARVPRP